MFEVFRRNLIKELMLNLDSILSTNTHIHKNRICLLECFEAAVELKTSREWQ